MLLAGISYSVAIFITILAFSSINLNNELMSHIILSISGYTLLLVSFVLSFVMSFQQNSLHSHKANTKAMELLPPLEKTEKLLFANIYLSFSILTLAIISGFIFLEDIFAQHLVHKTFFAIFAWILLLLITIARIKFGLRDKKATRTVQLAFILILIGYFGSKFVLNIVIN